jgi:chaperonin GroEL (HSP60 family)
MSFSSTAVRQQRRGKPLANTGTSVYNVKVNQGKEKSNLPGCIYLVLKLIIMTKEEAQKLLEECERVHLELGTDWMKGDLEVATSEQVFKLQHSALALHTFLEWFKQEEK